MYLTAVGLGPGDPELITLKGWRAIQEADIIFVPRSRDGRQSLALRIAKAWLSEQQEVVELPLPMTRNPDLLVPAWQAAADTILAHLADGQKGVYLLLGDPLLYGTFIYIWQILASDAPQLTIEIIPGITSFAAAAALAQLPLGTTSDRVAILPASYETDADALRRLLSDYDTVILMKVGTVMPQIVEALEELGLIEHAVYAERVGMPEEVIVKDVRSLRGQRRPYLSLLIVRRA